MIWRFLFRLALLFAAIKQRLRGKTLDTGKRDSEGSAEVVRVTEILDHGNADTLEVVKFEMAGTGPSAYEVVCRKGDFKPGDLANYFSIDCIVPTADPDFSFLLKRLDGAGKEFYRLKAARLRGRFSQGLLTPPSGKFGDQLWESKGIVYHQAPEPGQSTQPSGHKPKAQLIPVYEVTSLKKMPNLFADCPVLFITEKIHGTNFRFGWIRRRVLGVPVGWKFVVGSHRTIKDDKSVSWYGEDVWTEFAVRNDLARKTENHKGLVFYGELYGHTYGGTRIQDLTYGRHPAQGPGLAMFDVLGPDGWLDPYDRVLLCQRLGLPTVPNVSQAIADAAGVNGRPYAIEDLAEGPSLLCPTQIREGVVVESIGLKPRLKAKYVGKGYYERKGA